jgi:hypothetical protein
MAMCRKNIFEILYNCIPGPHGYRDGTKINKHHAVKKI